ncbi:hypothetical protein Bca52824_052477 [Brassica carinata]|uniref:Zinc knuckle CX2CX4HX4C domain-containing protein n=2 Tax=Brassica TaxID=3705 RepID=A0A8X7R438_BRACI|nr:hypothetical protein Bca52824_052477 [Brassica carinata]
MTQSSMIVRNGGSSNVRRKLESEDEIIQIPDCDLDAVMERFRMTLIGRVFNLQGQSIDALIHLLPHNRIWNVEGRVRGLNLGNGRFQFDFDNLCPKQMPLESFPNTIPFWISVTGVPVHFWNDQTFIAISKPLGTWTSLDSKRARILVSINVDKPLQFERRIEFPNGDIGRIFFSYEGLHRYCFTCHMISHDENACPQLTPEERELKRQQRAELDAQADPPSLTIGTMKRPRSSLNGRHSPNPGRHRLLLKSTPESSQHPVKTELTTPIKRNCLKSGNHLIGIILARTMGKTHITDTPTSRDREPRARSSSVIIRDPENRHQTHQHTISPRPEASSPGHKNNVPKQLDLDIDLDLGQDPEITLTEDEIALMDAEMLDNDDLLDEVPDDNAEKIDVISQLSPDNAETTNELQEDLSMVPLPTAPSQAKNDLAQTQDIAQRASLSMTSAKGYLKKLVPKNPELKGQKASKASKKLNQLRGRAPRKRSTLGNLSTVSSPDVPRNEVFPSALSKKPLSLSGSVVSQKPPSKRI